jgi:rubredoxin
MNRSGPKTIFKEHIMEWKCLVCGYVYSSITGNMENGIPPGTPFENLSPDWTCPDCGAMKDEFEMLVN